MFGFVPASPLPGWGCEAPGRRGPGPGSADGGRGLGLDHHSSARAGRCPGFGLSRLFSFCIQVIEPLLIFGRERLLGLVRLGGGTIIITGLGVPRGRARFSSRRYSSRPAGHPAWAADRSGPAAASLHPSGPSAGPRAGAGDSPSGSSRLAWPVQVRRERGDDLDHLLLGRGEVGGRHLGVAGDEPVFDLRAGLELHGWPGRGSRSRRISARASWSRGCRARPAPRCPGSP